MSTIGIVSLSLLGGMFLLFIIAIAVYQTYTTLQLRRLLQDIQVSLPLIVKEVGDTLKGQQRLLEDRIAALNGEKLVEAARANIASAKRIESACLAFAETVKTLVSEDYLQWKAEAGDGTGPGPGPGPGLGLGPGGGRSRIPPDAYANPDPDGAPYVSRSLVTSRDYDAMAGQESEGTATDPLDAIR